VGIAVGPTAFLSLARRLGFGERTGLPLIGETPGLVPNDEYMLKQHKRRILDGDTANMSIGQGDLLASPLQVAQAMAGIANGGALPRLQLITQIQDARGRVIKATVPERKNWLGVDLKAVEVVRDGMSDVVNTGYGTGRSGALSYTTLCGKTGTAQWGSTSKSQRLAWFAGFLPKDNPRYSFAVLYEGRPGETLSGGRMAAPMVRNFFEPIKDEIKDIIAPPQKALLVVEDEISDVPEIDAPAGVPAALPVEKPVRAEPVEETEAEPEEEETPVAPRPGRALPVGDDEVIDENFEDPE
jgi:penicillin-binding protein 2